jgi:pimeloyl-[acyl-carrier protein] methyl ester esterase
VEEAAKGRGALVGVGWSLGALSLLAAAARNPEAFKALVLVGGTPRFVKAGDFPHGQSRALVRRMIMDMKKDPSATVQRFYALNFTDEELGSNTVRSFIEQYRYPGPVVCSDGADTPPGCYPAFNYEDITRALEALYNTDLRGELARIKTPTLILHGDKDGVCPVGAGRFLAEKIEGAELQIIEGAGHAPFLTAEDEFVATTKKFLDGIK